MSSNYDVLISLWEKDTERFFSELLHSIEDGTLDDEDKKILIEKFEHGQSSIEYTELCYKLGLDPNNLKHRIGCYFVKYKYSDRLKRILQAISKVALFEASLGYPSLPAELRGPVERWLNKEKRKLGRLEVDSDVMSVLEIFLNEQR